jgi:hypothetical protein
MRLSRFTSRFRIPLGAAVTSCFYIENVPLALVESAYEAIKYIAPPGLV